jgi:hypothetical protein
MDDAGLRRALPPTLKPEDWYRLLNGRVFFWLTRERLDRLLGANAYRTAEHDVLEVDTAAIVRAYYDQVWLCPMNSGCTKPFAHPRGLETFSRIADYPYAFWKAKRRRGERVVELCIDEGVRDIAKFTMRAIRMRGNHMIDELFRRV